MMSVKNLVLLQFGRRRVARDSRVKTNKGSRIPRVKDSRVSWNIQNQGFLSTRIYVKTP